MYLTTSLKVILLLALGLWVQKAQSQVVVSPKIGISYMPFGTDIGGKYQRVDFLVGLSGRIQLSPSSFISSSISYVNRENPEGIIHSNPSGWFNTVYKHSDLNLDLIYQRQIYNQILIGLGGSLIYKLNTYYSEFYRHHDTTSDDLIDYLDKTEWWKGINLNVLYQLNPVEIKFKYSYFINIGEPFGFPGLTRTTGRNRFDLMVSYPFGFGEKNTSR